MGIKSEAAIIMKDLKVGRGIDSHIAGRMSGALLIEIHGSAVDVALAKDPRHGVVAKVGHHDKFVDVPLELVTTRVQELVGYPEEG